MTTPPLPAVPDEFGPNDPVVSFAMLECRTCRERSDWARTDFSVAPDSAAPHPWDFEHQESTGHTRFYVWSVSRNTAQVFPG